MSNFVQDYAKLLNERDSYTEQRKPVPKALSNRINNLEFRASQMLTPQQTQHALQHVEKARVEQRQATMQSEQLRQWRYDRVKQDRGIASASAGLSPEGKTLTAEQMRDAFNNDGKYTVKNREKVNYGAVDKHCRQKFGYGLKKRESNIEHLLAVSLKGNDRATNALGRDYKISPAELADYSKNGLAYHWEKHLQDQQKDEPESYEVQMGERGMLGNDIRQAMDRHHNEDIYDDDISEAYLEDEGLRGALANAWEEVEDNNINDELDGVSRYG